MTNIGTNYLSSGIQFLDALNNKKLVLISVGILSISQSGVIFIEFVRQDFQLRISGSGSYSRIAENIFNNGIYSLDGVTPTAYRPPVYPIFLASLKFMFGPNISFAVIVVQSLLFIACGILLVLISLKLFKKKTSAFIPVIIFSLHYAFLHEAIALRETVLFTTFVLLFFYVACRPKSIAVYVVLTCIATLAYLTRPTGILLFPIIVLDIIYQQYSDRRFLLTLTIVVGTGIFTLAPWYTYVFKNFHTVSFLPSSTAGVNLYKGNNSDFQTIYPYLDVDLYAPYITSQLVENDLVNDIVAADKFLKREALTFILHNPLRFIENGIIKFLAFYSPFPTPLGDGKIVGPKGNVTVEDFKFEQFGPSGLAHAILWLMVLVGNILLLINSMPISMLQLAKHQEVSLILVFIILATVMYTITFGETRFRLPFDPFFILFAGQGYAASII